MLPAETLPRISVELLDMLTEFFVNSVDVQGMYLVGGLVRDVLLIPEVTRGADPQELDVDITIEGDVFEFLKLLSEQLAKDSQSNWQVRNINKFKKYNTAKVEFLYRAIDSKDASLACCVDFAQCRSEKYLAPAAVPEIGPASIQDDLWRRDFSINAMAVSLISRESGNYVYGQLMDPCAGCADIVEKQLRVLHSKSFVDDPMRIVRGVRLAQRLGFSFETETERLYQDAIAQGYISQVSAYRRFDELRKATAEPKAAEILMVLHRDGVLAQLHPLIDQAYQRHESFEELPKLLSDRLISLFSTLSAEEKEALHHQLGLRKNESKLLGIAKQ